MGVNYTPHTWVTLEVPTAAEFNTEVRDLSNGLQAAWTAYTPTWTSSGTAPAIGNGSIVGAYMQVGKTFDFRIALTAGSTTTFGTGQYSFSLPATLNSAMSSVYVHGATGFISHGGNRYPIIGANIGGTTTMTLAYISAVGGAALSSVTNAAPQTLVSTDVISLAGRFESA